MLQPFQYPVGVVLVSKRWMLTICDGQVRTIKKMTINAKKPNNCNTVLIMSSTSCLAHSGQTSSISCCFTHHPNCKRLSLCIINNNEKKACYLIATTASPEISVACYLLDLFGALFTIISVEFCCECPATDARGETKQEQ